MHFIINDQHPIHIFVAETTYDPLWNPGIFHYIVKNYKDYMDTLQDLFEDGSAHIILCKEEDRLYGFQQEADVEGWGGVYDPMTEKDIDYWKHITELKLIDIAS
jgi:hypothetical protein